MELAKVILLTKDAYDTIESFIQFYGYLFDYHNIVIVDNGSTDSRVLAVYDMYISKGVTVVYDSTSFFKANEFMTKYMNNLKGKCEFIIPMETDEFMFWIPKQSDKSYRLLREDVHNYLKSLPKDVAIVRYGAFYASSVRTDDADYKGYMYSDPPRQMTKFWNQGWDKILVRADAFVSVQQWLHHVDVSYGSKITSDTLGLLHFHDTGAKRDWERSESLVSVQGFGYIDFNLPKMIQLVMAKFYKDRHAPGYHRLEKFYNFVRKRLIAEMFQCIVGRLPSLQELNSMVRAKNETVEYSIEQIMIHYPLYQKTEVRPTTMDQLLYWEPSQDYLYEIHHVANVLRWLSESPSASVV